jgi:dienelactone hydrolase
MVRALVVALALVLLGCAPSLEKLKPALTAEDFGTVWFASGKTVLSGDLRLPSGAGPFAAVVLMHGCGGMGNAERGWVDPLRGAGYATFVVDSLGGRGLREVCTDATALPANDRIPDAYAALSILATHPRVDRGRVALMGFSHGGIVALRGATAWAREPYAKGGVAFRAFVPFYPYCNTRFPEMDHLSAPVRIHTGELDDWTPAAPCQQLVARLVRRGQDARITVYPGAHHSFDNIGRSLVRLANVDSGAGCFFELPSLAGPQPPADAVRACLTKGATIGWNPEATEQARRDVLAELAELLR